MPRETRYSMIRIFTSKTQQIGEKGEEMAKVFLMKQGFTVIEQNVANKYGEIDIVAKKSNLWYFFEVKAGKKSSFFNPAENLTEKKIRKFRISVEHYTLIHSIKNYKMQGVIVLIGAGGSKVEIIDIT